MTFGDFIVSKQVGFQAFFITRLWDSSGGSWKWMWRTLNEYVIFCGRITGRLCCQFAMYKAEIDPEELD
jgi:hypothetical protein